MRRSTPNNDSCHFVIQVSLESSCGLVAIITTPLFSDGKRLPAQLVPHQSPAAKASSAGAMASSEEFSAPEFSTPEFSALELSKPKLSTLPLSTTVSGTASKMGVTSAASADFVLATATFLFARGFRILGIETGLGIATLRESRNSAKLEENNSANTPRSGIALESPVKPTNSQPS